MNEFGAHVQPLSVTLIFGIILALGDISLRVLIDPPNARSQEQS